MSVVASESAVYSSISTRSMSVALVLAYGMSGMTSLAYEVLWARMLELQFGVSIFGIVVSIATFMLGLGLGSLAGLRVTAFRFNQIFLFGMLESCVALYAIASPHLLHAQESALAALATHTSLASWYGLETGSAFFMLLVPALALGAAFALILGVLTPARVSLGRLYGVNACGGALGALLPLWLLPTLGWATAIRVVALPGLACALGIIALSRLRLNSIESPLLQKKVVCSPAVGMLLAYAGIGAAGLMLEIAWIRLYGMVLLRTEYVLAIILAVYVAGIGLGSLMVAARTSVVCARYSWCLVALPVVMATMAVLSVWVLPAVSSWAESARFDGLFAAMTWQGLVLAAVTLPVTIGFGAWLPLLSMRSNVGANNGAWLYGANSLGAAAGAVIAGAVLLPLLGAPGTACCAALLLPVCSLAWCPTARGRAVLVIALFGLVALAWPVRYLPPVARLLPQAQAGARDVFRYEDAVTLTHVIERNDGQRQLLTDLQRMDAATDPDAVVVQKNEARLPLLLHPAPHSVLFLGLGTGISAAGSQPFPGISRTAVELSQGAIEALPWFAPVSGGAPPGMHLVHDDARRFLLTDTGFYDVIIGDLFHPDLAGEGELLSVQQFARARAHLTHDGVFVQWLALNQFDTGVLNVVLRSFQSAFPNAVLFVDGFRVALVGPKYELQGAPAMLANLNRLSPDAQRTASGNEGPWTWLGRYWGRIDVPPGPVQDEWAPHIEFQLPRARYNGALNLAAVLDSLLADRPDLQEAIRQLHVAARDKMVFERAYDASELAMHGWLASLQGSDDGARLIRLANQANPNDRWVAATLADSMLATLPEALAHGITQREALRKILEIRPDHAETLRALWHLEQADGNADQAHQFRERLHNASPLDKEAR